jgi:hypothetical protein
MIVYVVIAACGKDGAQQTARTGPTAVFTPCDHVYPGGGDIRWAEKEFPGKAVLATGAVLLLWPGTKGVRASATPSSASIGYGGSF